MTPQPLRLVIFDCDGVLVDSEGPSNRVCAEEITKLGWPMKEADSMALFMGFRLSDMPPVIEAHLGRPVPEGWVDQLRNRMIAAFVTLETMPGAHAVLRDTLALGLPIRVASNSSHEEMDVKFRQTGLDALVPRARRHSARDVARGKPSPDVFLAAAAAEGIPPEACLVIEDSLPGIAAATAAGMPVIALAPYGATDALRATTAHPVSTLAELPALFAAAMAIAA